MNELPPNQIDSINTGRPSDPKAWGLGFGSYGHTIHIEYENRREMISKASDTPTDLYQDPTENYWVLQTWSMDDLPETYSLQEHTPNSVRLVTLEETLLDAPEEIRDAVEGDVRLALFEWSDGLQDAYSNVMGSLDDPMKIRALYQSSDIAAILRGYDQLEKRYKNLLLDATQALKDSFEQNPPQPHLDHATDLRKILEEPITVAIDPWGGRDKEAFYQELRKILS